MTPHKILRECFDLSREDQYLVKELLDQLTTASSDFENVGAEFTYEKFVEWFKRIHKNSLTSTTNTWYSSLLKAVEGDNLDKIEDAAEDKGLL